MFKFINIILLIFLAVWGMMGFNGMEEAAGKSDYVNLILNGIYFLSAVIGIAANYIVWLSHVEVYVSPYQE